MRIHNVDDDENGDNDTDAVMFYQFTHTARQISSLRFTIRSKSVFPPSAFKQLVLRSGIWNCLPDFVRQCESISAFQ